MHCYVKGRVIGDQADDTRDRPVLISTRTFRDLSGYSEILDWHSTGSRLYMNWLGRIPGRFDHE